MSGYSRTGSCYLHGEYSGNGWCPRCGSDVDETPPAPTRSDILVRLSEVKAERDALAERLAAAEEVVAEARRFVDEYPLFRKGRTLLGPLPYAVAAYDARVRPVYGGVALPDREPPVHQAINEATS